MRPTDHYVVISADTHAGGSHQQYREFLDPKYRDDFDAWRNKYKNPFKDLKDTDLRIRNWDDDKRDGDQNADGVVGEVIFPNTVPPFFPNFVLFAQPPTAEEYEHRHAGIQAHNRWLADYVSRKPEARAGIGQIFLNDVDDAIEDVKWCHANGLRGGVLVGSVPPTCDWIKPLYHPVYDPLWAVCEELGVPVNAHSGTGGPVYQKAPAMPLVHFLEIPFYSQRPLAYMILGGVFERFPNLKFVLTEAGCAWIPEMLGPPRRADGQHPRQQGRRDALRRRARAAALGDRVLPAELLRRHQPAHPRRHQGGARPGRHRPRDVGQRLPARGGHPPLHPRAPAPGDGPPRAGADPADPGRQRGEALQLRPRCAAAGCRQVRPDGRRRSPSR